MIRAREAFLQTQDAKRQALANEVRREVEWLRRGPKARSSKAGYRIDEARRKIAELSEAKRRHESETELAIDFRASGRRTHDLITAHGIEKSLGGRLLFRGLDVHLRPGTRLGIVGNNASGKTTLLKTLAGTLPPDHGYVKHATCRGLRPGAVDPHPVGLISQELRLKGNDLPEKVVVSGTMLRVAGVGVEGEVEEFLLVKGGHWLYRKC